MQLYRFSPIRSQAELLAAATYVAEQTKVMLRQIVGTSFPVSAVTIFSHFSSEFSALAPVLGSLGTPDGENNGPWVKLYKPIAVGANSLTRLRIRKPDPYRSQVGCNDFNVPSYQAFRNAYLSRCSGNMRLIERESYEMVEVFNPEFDVLAYVVSHPI